MNHQDWLQTATEAAEAGAEQLMHYLGQVTQIRTKTASGDLVTEADLASEAAVIKVLSSAFPEHAILAEESGLHAHSSDYLWVIDPLDGTLNYAHCMPFFCVSIALFVKGTPEIGVVLAPQLRECFQGIRGQGAWLNQAAIEVSSISTLKQSFLATGFPYHRAETEDNNYQAFSYFADRSQDIRRAGSAALDLAYVACGRYDAYWERHLNPWDVGAGVVLVAAAGGQVSAYDGQAIDLYSGEIVASNGHLHDLMVRGLIETDPLR